MVDGRPCLIMGIAKSRVVMMAALAAPETVVMTTFGATSDFKIYIKLCEIKHKV